MRLERRKIVVLRDFIHARRLSSLDGVALDALLESDAPSIVDAVRSDPVSSTVLGRTGIRT